MRIVRCAGMAAHGCRLGVLCLRLLRYCVQQCYARQDFFTAFTAIIACNLPQDLVLRLDQLCYSSACLNKQPNIPCSATLSRFRTETGRVFPTV